MSQFIDLDFKPSAKSEKEFDKFFKKYDNEKIDVDADFSQAEKEAKKFINETEKEIKSGLGGAFDSVNKEIGKNFDSLKSSATSIADSVTGGLVGGLVGGGVAGAVAFIGDKLFEGAAAALEFSKEITQLQNNIQNLTGLQGRELTDFTARIQATASTFGESSEEVFKSAQKLAAQTGEDINSVLDNLQSGFINGANSSGELLAVTQEYGNVIKEVGGDSADLVRILQRSEQTGVFSDKGIDVVKEFGLRIRELPQSTKDALQGIGLDAEDIQKRLESGQSNVLDILAETSTRLGELPAQSTAVGTAIADIFGGAGEDAGLQYLLTLKDINDETNNLTSNLTEAQKRQQETLANSEAFNKLFIDLFGGLSSNLTDFLNELKSGFLQILEIVNLGEFFADLKAGFNETLEGAQPLFNFIKNVLGAAIVFLIERIKLGISIIESLFSAYSNALNPIFELIEDVTNEFTKLFEGVGSGIDLFGVLRDVIDVLINLAILPLKVTIQVVVEIFRFFFNLVLSGIKIVKDFYNESALLQGLFKTLGNVTGFVGRAIRGLLETLGILEEKKPEKPIKQLAKEQKEVTKETKELNKEVPKLSNNINTFKQKAKETTLDSLIQELAILKIAGKDTSTQYTQLIEKAVKLKTSQDELSEAVKQVKLELENYTNSLNQADLETSELADTSGNELNKLFNGIQKDIGKTGQTFKGLPLLAVPSLDEINENVDLTKVNFENLGTVIGKIGGDFSAFGETVFNAIDKIIKINEKSESSWEDYGEIVADVFGQSANLAEENSALQKSLAITQVIINTAIAISKALGQLGAFAIPATVAIGALGAAQIATILGAEDGVIGLDSSYNKKPGKTDKYPFLLAKGESVVNAQSTAQNRPYLEFINNGGNLGDVFGVMTNKIDGTNERLERLERALGKSVLTRQTFNLVVENRNKSKISGAVRV